ncbi:hypothetical protein HYV50_04685 [Candidatus Pacearchaeota archaeon]|nr:hypothetical protein [Candidatus Pacearchaeota archaeon]
MWDELSKQQKIDYITEAIKSGKSSIQIVASLDITKAMLYMFCSRNEISLRNEKNIQGKTSKFQKQLKKNKLSISQRIMELCSLEVSDSTFPKHFSDEQLLYWRNNIEGFKQFCFEVLNITLQSHQIDIAEKMHNNRHSVFICGRRSGKTLLSALYCLWRALIQPSERITLISPSYESSLIIFRMILEQIAKSEELRWDIKRDTSDELTFQNDSNIKSLSAQSLAVRGRENSIVIIDEASSLENDKEVIASVSPSLASRPNSQLILISTPRSRQGLLWESWNSPLYAKAQYPSTSNKFLDLEWYELEKQKLPIEVFQMEYEAQWCDVVDLFFPLKLINKCKQKYDFINFRDTGKPLYICGIDIGRLHDYSVVVVISKNGEELKVENIFTFYNIPFQAQVSRFMRIFDVFHIDKVVIEHNGLSMPIVEQLENEYDRNKIKRFQPTIKTKEEIYFNLLKKMEEGSLTIPDYEPLINEMRNFQFVYTPKGVKLHHSSSSSDDILDALAMAVSGVKSYRPILMPVGAGRY